VADLERNYRRLVVIVGQGRISRSPMERMMASHDISSHKKRAPLLWRMVPDFVVLPRTTEEVSRIVRLASKAGLPIVPRGGGSGLVGGAVPSRGGILVDMRQMDQVRNVDTDRRTMTVQAGRTWKEAAEAAASRGMFLPVSPLGAPASTIGGWYSNGGVGYGSPRYGSARDIVLDLEVVLPSGEVMHTADDSVDIGPSYANLGPAFFGAEGTLGLITEATLQLSPKPEAFRPLAYSFGSLWSARKVIGALAASDVEPYHVSLLDPVHLALVKRVRPEALAPQALANVVLEGPKDEVVAGEKEVDEIIHGLGGKKLGEDVAKSQWDARFDLYPARRITGGLVVAEDLVPLKRFPEALRAAARLSKGLRMQAAVNSFLVDPNTVAVVPYFLLSEGKLLATTAVAFTKKFGDAVFDLDGHPQGLGLFAAYNFPRMHRGVAELHESAKAAFDPQGLVNPGKTLEVGTRFRVPVFDAVSPEVMSFGYEVDALLRRMKPTAERYVDTGGAA